MRIEQAKPLVFVLRITKATQHGTSRVEVKQVLVALYENFFSDTLVVYHGTTSIA